MDEDGGGHDSQNQLEEERMGSKDGKSQREWCLRTEQ